jgi:hypothetical protein
LKPKGGRRDRQAGGGHGAREPAQREGEEASGRRLVRAGGDAGDRPVGRLDLRQAELRIGDDFLEWIAEEDAELSLRFGRKWVEVSEEEARKTDIYGHLATFLAEKYVIGEGNRNHGKKMAVGTVHGVWRGLVNERREQFKLSTNLETQVDSCALPACALRVRARAALPARLRSAAALCAVRTR